VRNLLTLRSICSIFPFGIEFAGRFVRYHVMFKNQKGNFAFLLGLMFAFANRSAFTNGMRLVSQDGFATARGEAFVATADNASAVYYNPAGISQIAGDQARSGVYGIYFDSTFRPPAAAANGGNTYHVKQNTAAAPQLFVTHEFADTPFTFGFGSYSPYGLGLEWPNDTGFYAVGTKSQVTYLRFNPVLSIKILPGLSIAGGAMVDYAKLELRQGLRATAQPLPNTFQFSGAGWNVGYNFGLLWQAHSKVSIGVTYRSATYFNLSGNTDIQRAPVIPLAKRDAEAGFVFPMTVAGGIAWKPTPQWNLEIDADYTDWSSLDRVTIHHFTPPNPPLQQDYPFNLYWRPSWVFSAGLTRYFENGWHVSAGYVFNQSSVPDTYYSPLIADVDRHFLSVGVGNKGRKYDFDVAYQFGYGPDHNVIGSSPSSSTGFFIPQTADGTYDFVSHAILMTVGIRF